MKHIYLHGELGKRFGRKWELNVSSASEAISALFANEPQIERYLIQKEIAGIAYGIKGDKKGGFLTKEEGGLHVAKDFHVVPVPQGAGGFTVSVLLMAVGMAASLYVSKKFAEAMERDDRAVAIQTQSYIYQGGANRMEQGGTIPVGYGRLKVGSNVISSSILNYQYDSEEGQIVNFDDKTNDGLTSIVPPYSPKYNPDLGPLGSSLVLRGFDGRSEFSFTDPAFQRLKGKSKMKGIGWGANDGMYGYTGELGEEYAAKSMNLSKKGNIVGGYFYYEMNWGKGIDVSKLGNFDKAGGNWWPDRKNETANRSQDIWPYMVSGSANAKISAFCALQSVPQLETSTAYQRFYPILFGTGQKDQTVSSPLLVGTRYIDGNKEDGAGWRKLESVGIYKAVDLVCEGSIEGFSNDAGETLTFTRDKTPNCVTADPEDPGTCLRNTADDYLQGIFIDDTPIKEVINPGQVVARDSYNINEFDIDIGTDMALTDKNGQFVIGTDSQMKLESQYQFTAHTSEVSGPLYGHRSLSLSAAARSAGQGEVEEFIPGKLYPQGKWITEGGNAFRVQRGLNNEFSRFTNYEFTPTVSAPIVYVGKVFYMAQDSVNDYVPFSSSSSFSQGDKIKETQGDTRYYHVGSNAALIKGEFNKSQSYSSPGLLFSNGISYEITGAWQANGTNYPAGRRFINSFCDILAVPDPAGGIIDISTPQVYMASQKLAGYFEEKDITPGKATDTAEGLWSQININGTDDITDKDKNPIEVLQLLGESAIFVGAGDAGAVGLTRREEEEYYLSHTVINPLVGELYISLQIDELTYVYEGDSVDISYSPGPLMMALFGALAAIALTADIVEDAADFPPGASIPVIIATWTGIAILGAIIGFAAGSLMKFKMGNKVENSGELWPSKAMFRIKYGNEGETNTYFTDVYIYGVATSSYRKDIKIYLPPNPLQKDRTVKIYKLNRERNPVKEGEGAARYKEKMALAAITEITPVELTYPNSVVIGTRINARDFPSIPKRNYNLKLKRVAIPSNYDSETREYSGNWNGLFKGQCSKKEPIGENQRFWTDNPAWCLYDLISNPLYGVGKFGIETENIDRWTLYKIAKYCDEVVPTGYSPKYKKRQFELSGAVSIKILDPTGGETYPATKFKTEFNYPTKKLAIFYGGGTHEIRTIKSTDPGTQLITLDRAPSQKEGECAVEIDYPLVEPRYTLNAYLMNAQNAFKLINEFAAVFRAYAYWAGSEIHFFQDEEKDSVMLFSNNNISDEGFSYSSTPKTSRTNSCKIKYLDQYNKFRPKMEYAEDRDQINKNNIIEQSIDGFGITSKGQAKRAAEFIVQGANLETEIVSLKTNVIGAYLRPGDVFDAMDDKRTVGRFAGKVLDVAISGDGKTAEIDIDFPVRTIIDESDPSTHKKITLYNISGNQTIESLDAMTVAKDCVAASVTDQDINNMRAGQIGEYIVSNISQNDTRLKIINNPYKFVTGEYTWPEALLDARTRGGKLATITSDNDQILVEAILPTDATGWIGGYYKKGDPTSYWAWYQPVGCDSDEIKYFSWAPDQPYGLGDALQTDIIDEVLNTDVDEVIMTDPETDLNSVFIAVSGSTDAALHGDWINLSGNSGLGYILDGGVDDSLFGLDGIEGTTFALEDTVNLAVKKQYKVVNIKEESEGIFAVQGLQYNSGKFGHIENNVSLPPPLSPIIFTQDPLDPPTNILVEELTAPKKGGDPGLRATWNTVEAASSYKVQFFTGNTLLASFEIPNTTDASHSLDYRSDKIIEGGTYYVRIYSLTR